MPRQHSFMMMAIIGGMMMDFDLELEKLLEITDHDELIEEYAFFCADVDCYFNELDNKAYTKPDWWYIGLGFKKAISPRHEEEAKFIYKQFLKFKGCPGDDFKTLIEKFTLAKSQNKFSPH